MKSAEPPPNSHLVSVIIIFLNGEKFIREAIESVFSQTYDNWELLLVDDGSSDSSTQIARCYSNENSRKVRYLEHANHRNRGMSASRNLGMRHANGDYIAFLDADDVWWPDKLERQVETLNSHPKAAMTFGPVQWWYSWTGNAEDLRRDFVKPLDVQPDSLMEGPELLVSLLQKEAPTTTASLMRRNAIADLGGFEESFRGLYEDQVFFAKICSKQPVYVTSTCSYRWRNHAHSSCSNAVKNNGFDSARLAFLIWLEKYLFEQGISHRELSTVLKPETRQCRRSVVFGLVSAVLRRMKDTSRSMARRLLPSLVLHWLRTLIHGRAYVPPVGRLRFGDFRRTFPIQSRLGNGPGYSYRSLLH